MKLYAVGITDIGNVRTENQDFFGVHTAPCADNGSSLLVVVADGVGGGKAGGVASRLAVESLKNVFMESAAEPQEVMRMGIESANARIFGTAGSDEACSGMATTCTALMVMGGAVTVGHVGDSRAYRVRDGEITQLTEDHTLPRRLLKQGLITEEQVLSHPQGNVLTNAVGSRNSISVDVFPVEMKERDIFILCSDGLFKYLKDEEMTGIIRMAGIDAAPERLVATAKERGGDDNITVVVVEVSGEEFDKTTEIASCYEPPPEGEKRIPWKLMVFGGVMVAALSAALYLW